MRFRSAVAAVLLITLSACGGSGASAPTTTSVPSGGNPSTAPLGTPAAAIDLSGIDACALVDDATVSALTGVDDFTIDQRNNRHCFWGVSDPNVPQYLEIDLMPRPGGLAGFEWTVAEGCALSPIAGGAIEAMGAVCTSPQKKVALVAWDRGVVVRILVNEPKAPLTPEDLLDAARTVVDQLG